MVTAPPAAVLSFSYYVVLKRKPWARAFSVLLFATLAVLISAPWTTEPSSTLHTWRTRPIEEDFLARAWVPISLGHAALAVLLTRQNVRAWFGNPTPDDDSAQEAGSNLQP